MEKNLKTLEIQKILISSLKNKFYLLSFLLVISSCVFKQKKIKKQEQMKEEVSFALWGADLKEVLELDEKCKNKLWLDWSYFEELTGHIVKPLNPRCDSLELIIKPYPIKEYNHKNNEYLIYYNNKTFYYYKLIKKQTLEKTHYIIE